MIIVMYPKKIEKRQRVGSDEIVEAGEQKIMQMNGDINRAIAALEEIDDDTNNAIDEARKVSDAVCGLYGISEPSSEGDEVLPLLSATDEAEDLQTTFRETEEELAQIDGSTTELSIEELAKLFGF